MATRSNFIVTNDGSEADVNWVEFSGGELHPRCMPMLLGRSNVTNITAKITSAADIVALMLLTDAVKRTYKPKVLTLTMPYVPYGRQDRVCNEGESFGIKVVANIINSLGFDTVYTLMPHSDVTSAVIENLDTKRMTNTWDKKLMEYGNDLYARTKKDIVVVSPDSGANKRTLNFVTKWNSAIRDGQASMPWVRPIRADKVRDAVNGAILDTRLYALPEDVKDAHVIIYDDIVDGGMTFIKIAEVLQESRPASVILAAPHGIFSKGFSPFNGLIDTVITTSTFITDSKVKDAASVLDLTVLTV